MQEADFLRMVFTINATVESLEAKLLADITECAGSALEINELLRQHAAVLKIKDKVMLLRYADPADLSPSIGTDPKDMIAEFEKTRKSGLQPSGVKTHQILEKVERDVFGIIHPMEVVGKWPPDRSPR